MWHLQTYGQQEVFSYQENVAWLLDDHFKFSVLSSLQEGTPLVLAMTLVSNSIMMTNVTVGNQLYWICGQEEEEDKAVPAADNN